MSIDRVAFLRPEQRLIYARKIESILAQQTPTDMLLILTIVADNALQQMKVGRERERIGALFVKELQLRIALREYSDAERRGPTGNQKSDEIGSNHVYVKLDDADELATGLVDYCAGSPYRSIVHAVPMAVGAILRDYPKDRDRNDMILNIISVCKLSPVSTKIRKGAGGAKI